MGWDAETVIWWYAYKTIQGPTPGGKRMHHGAIAEVMSWGGVFLFERNRVIKISAVHWAGYVLHLLCHTPHRTGRKVSSQGAIAFPSSNGPCWPPGTFFACDPGRDIIRRWDGIRGQGRRTLGHATAAMELGEVGKGWLMFIEATAIKSPRFTLLSSVLLFNSRAWQEKNYTAFAPLSEILHLF